MQNLVKINGNSLTIDDVVAVARGYARVEIDESCLDGIQKSRKYVEDALASGQAIYGINTGFGLLANVAISADQLEELQKKLIYADCAGIGKNFDTEVVRTMMLLRANAVCKGYSGIRLEVIQCLVDMLNERVHPLVREKGSVGSSGDLIPLAHMVLVMLGEGEAEYQGEIIPGAVALEKAGIKPISLLAKEGLALINGTQAMMGNGVLAVADALKLIKVADIAAAFTMETLEGIINAFDPRIQEARPHKGQIEVAENVRRLAEGSKLTTTQGQLRMQDAYSIRCVPQVHGASRLAIEYVKSVVETEINSATDNPLVFYGEDGAVYSGGNFHGQPIAIAMDVLGIAVSEIANISERRIERLVNPALSNGLPAFLVANAGINCGFMLPQYAAAALVSENKVLAHPASVDSIPTSANQEDHVSMGTIAARKARQIVEHVGQVLGLELLSAAQAADFKGPEKLGKASKSCYDLIRSKVSFMEEDRIMYPDQDKVYELVKSGAVVKEVESVVGELK